MKRTGRNKNFLKTQLSIGTLAFLSNQRDAHLSWSQRNKSMIFYNEDSADAQRKKCNTSLRKKRGQSLRGLISRNEQDRLAYLPNPDINANTQT